MSIVVLKNANLWNCIKISLVTIDVSRVSSKPGTRMESQSGSLSSYLNLPSAGIIGANYCILRVHMCTYVYVYLYMFCVCIHACTYMCIHPCMHDCVSIYMFLYALCTCIYVYCVYKCIYVYMCACVYTCMCVCILCLCAHTCVYICMHVHVCMYVCLYVFMYEYMCIYFSICVHVCMCVYTYVFIIALLFPSLSCHKNPKQNKKPNKIFLFPLHSYILFPLHVVRTFPWEMILNAAGMRLHNPQTEGMRTQSPRSLWPGTAGSRILLSVPELQITQT